MAPAITKLNAINATDAADPRGAEDEAEAGRRGMANIDAKKTTPVACPRFRRKARLLLDSEIRELTHVTSPANVDRVDPRRRGAVVGPAHDLFDRVFFAFGHDFHRAVVSVLYPTGHAEPPSLPLGRCTEKDACDAAADDELNALVRHGVGFFLRVLPNRQALGNRRAKVGRSCW